jgi:hypothetical protein
MSSARAGVRSSEPRCDRDRRDDYLETLRRLPDIEGVDLAPASSSSDACPANRAMSAEPAGPGGLSVRCIA